MQLKSLLKNFASISNPQASALLLLCLLPIFVSGCLTLKSSKTPAVRGLKASEAERLESQNIPSWQKQKQFKREKEDPPENFVDMADIYLQNGDYERSILNYSRTLSKNPDRHEIRYRLGVALLLTGNLEESKKELAEVLLHKMDMVEAHEALGVIYLQETNFAAAQQEFRSALALDPGRYQSRYLIGETLLRQKEYSQAISELKAALSSAPKSARIVSAIGWCYFNQKNYEQGLQWLKKAQDIEPGNQKIKYRLGMVLAAQKKFPEALETFRQAGDEAQGYNNLGVHYYLDHRYNEAVRCFQKALELRPTYYEEAKMNLDKALARLQEVNGATIGQQDGHAKELSLSKVTSKSK